MKIYVVIELVYGNEGMPHILAFIDRKERDAAARKLKAEKEPNGVANPDVLIVKQTLNVKD